jgi:hypothetical protein
MDNSLSKLNVKRKTGQEKFRLNDKPLNINLLGFWQWSASDLPSNTARGILAEYIVASALGISEGIRSEWDAYDLVTKSGLKVEVKSAAYLQAWYQKKLSNIAFSIQPTKKWDANSNEFSKLRKRQSDVYIFCLLNHKEKKTLDPLNLNQWEFYILSTAVLNQKHPKQATIGLTSLLKLNPSVAKYDEIASCIKVLNR